MMVTVSVSVGKRGMELATCATASWPKPASRQKASKRLVNENIVLFEGYRGFNLVKLSQFTIKQKSHTFRHGSLQLDAE
jgi:hypothetical protein